MDFKLAGDPKQLLRAINPGEAAFFDRAAGIHVRFRLGGLSFPPCIYYKVAVRPPFPPEGGRSLTAWASGRQEHKNNADEEACTKS